MPDNLKGAGQRIAIVDAYATTSIQSDLDTWSAAVGIKSTKLQQVYPPSGYVRGDGPKQGRNPGSNVNFTGEEVCARGCD